LASRRLSEGEVAMAAALFGTAIGYAKVRIHDRRYMPFQPKNCAMTPNGRLYFHHARFLDDNAAGDIHAQHWAMHEMVKRDRLHTVARKFNYETALGHRRPIHFQLRSTTMIKSPGKI
jgi:hypothetical protein